MFYYVLMKILESAPYRYDRAIRMITFGRLEDAYRRMASVVKKGQRILDIGCGAGMLTIMAAGKGADVKGIDINPQMLEVAKQKAGEAGLRDRIELCEMGAAEIDAEKADSYDVVMIGLCLSKLGDNELEYILKEVRRVLKPGGLLLIADEVVPNHIIKRIITRTVRLPLMIITYMMTQTTTKPIKGLPEKILKNGFIIESIKLGRMEDFIEIVAKKDR